MGGAYAESLEELYGYPLSDETRESLRIIRMTMVLILLFFFYSIYFIF